MVYKPFSWFSPHEFFGADPTPCVHLSSSKDRLLHQAD